MVGASEYRSLCISVISSSSLRWFLHVTLGSLLESRIELASSFTSINQIREAGALKGLGLSPYFGSAVRSPPLLILALESISTKPGVLVTPFILADLLSCFLAYSISHHVEKTSNKPLPISPSAISTIFLWNPCTVLTAAAASSATFTVTCVLFALHSAVVQRSALLSSLGCAMAIYLDASTVYFLLPVVVLLALGPEDIMAVACPDSRARRYSTPVDVTAKHTSVARTVTATGQSDPSATVQEACQQGGGSDWKACVAFFICVTTCAMALVVLSEATIMTWPHGHCLSWIPIPAVYEPSEPLDTDADLLQRLVLLAARGKHITCTAAQWVSCRISEISSDQRLDFSAQSASVSPQLASDEAGKSWISQSYGGMILFEDLTPNLGLWWYFIAEMFKEFRQFFKFVLHSQTAIFTVPIAIRFQTRPLFSFFLHTMLVAIFKPYPVMADTMYLTLLPLFVPVLEWAQPGILLGFMMLVAAVMAPSTLYQWLYTASANSNFYYAFTMLWGGAQVVLMLLITHAVIQKDREVLGKPQRFFLTKKKA